MCLTQGHNAVTPVRLEPAALRSRVKHSTTEPLRSLPLDIGLSLIDLLPLHCVYWNFDTIKIVLSLFKATIPIFKNTAYFSVTSIALSDVNVKGGNVIKPLAREIDSDQSLYRYSRYRGNESENYGYVINAY